MFFASVNQGTVVAHTEWRAIISIAISPVRELGEVLKNPLGIFITEINMAQDLSRTRNENE